MRKEFWKAFSLALCTTTLLSQPVSAATEGNSLFKLSLKELANMEVTSVSKKEQKVNKTAAAVFVITKDDIKRIGATSIPEALRVAPGVNVARSGANEWAVSIRGFNDQFSNKLLVLIDGRSVYSPIFSGVFWDSQMVPLEEIERIEVVRGPGGTVWGANAVNGVINIITKNSKDTKGNSFVAQAGTLDGTKGYFRNGGDINEHTTYRAFGQYEHGEEMKSALSGASADDSFGTQRAGLRVDSQQGKDKWSVHSDVYNVDEDVNYIVPSRTSPTRLAPSPSDSALWGGDILGRYDHNISDDNVISLQAFISHDHRGQDALTLDATTSELELTNTFKASENNEVTWGAAYRNVILDTEAQNYISFSPDGRVDNLYSAFIQNEHQFIPNELALTLGSKIEHNNYSGLEIQPSARLAWTPTEAQTYWASVSRAVRTPSQYSEDGSIALAAVRTSPTSIGVLRQFGQRDTDAENLIAYEVGGKWQINDKMLLDTALFYNDYKEILIDVPGVPSLVSDTSFGTYVQVPYVTVNGGVAKTYGFEVNGTAEVTDQLQVSAGYSFLKMDVGATSTFVATSGKNPTQQITLRTDYSFAPDWEWNNTLYWMDQLHPSATTEIPSYLRYDTRLAWQATDGVEVSLVGQNLLDDYHQEFGGFIYNQPVEIGRSVYARVGVEF
jgi:iron complex outermembrane recepter protein